MKYPKYLPHVSFASMGGSGLAGFDVILLVKYNFMEYFNSLEGLPEYIKRTYPTWFMVVYFLISLGCTFGLAQKKGHRFLHKSAIPMACMSIVALTLVPLVILGSDGHQMAMFVIFCGVSALFSVASTILQTAVFTYSKLFSPRCVQLIGVGNSISSVIVCGANILVKMWVTWVNTAYLTASLTISIVLGTVAMYYWLQGMEIPVKTADVEEAADVEEGTAEEMVAMNPVVKETVRHVDSSPMKGVKAMQAFFSAVPPEAMPSPPGSPILDTRAQDQQEDATKEALTTKEATITKPVDIPPTAIMKTPGAIESKVMKYNDPLMFLIALSTSFYLNVIGQVTPLDMIPRALLAFYASDLAGKSLSAHLFKDRVDIPIVIFRSIFPIILLAGGWGGRMSEGKWHLAFALTMSALIGLSNGYVMTRSFSRSADLIRTQKALLLGFIGGVVLWICIEPGYHASKTMLETGIEAGNTTDMMTSADPSRFIY